MLLDFLSVFHVTVAPVCVILEYWILDMVGACEIGAGGVTTGGVTTGAGGVGTGGVGGVITLTVVVRVTLPVTLVAVKVYVVVTAGQTWALLVAGTEPTSGLTTREVAPETFQVKEEHIPE